MAKGAREKIKLESTAGTGHFYTTSKNKKTTPDKMLIMRDGAQQAFGPRDEVLATLQQKAKA